MDAKEFLKQAYRIDDKIYILEMEISECKNLLNKISNLESNNIHNSDEIDQNNIIIKIKECEKDLINNISKLIDIKENLNKVLGKINNENYKVILKLRHINYKSFVQISEILHEPYKTVYQKHKRALKKVSEILESME